MAAVISPGGREVAVGRQDHAVLALDRLEDDGGGLVGRRRRAAPSASPYGTWVTSPGSGSNGVPLGGLAGQRERAHGAAVEAALGGDQMRPRPVTPGRS